MPGARPLLVAGRYALFDPIARGGMATVHLGRLVGAAGFARIVAIKRLLSSFASDPELTAAFLDEARLAARIRHGNVAATIDVVEEKGEAFLVYEYVHGASIALLMKALAQRGERCPPDVAAFVMAGALRGLHAAHEARAEDGSPLAIVHRDVSPQNVLVGADGITKVIDFGIAKANVRATSTRAGQLKGKLAYMAPEQLGGHDVSRGSDIYAAGIVIWEMLAGRRLWKAPTEAGMVGAILAGQAPRLADEAPWVTPSLAWIVERAMARDPADRWATALEMAIALDIHAGGTSADQIGEWVGRVAADSLAHQSSLVAQIETGAGIAPELESAPLPPPAPLAPSADDSVVRTATAVDVKPSSSPRKLVAALVVLALLGLAAGGVFLGRRASRTEAPASLARTAPAPRAAASEVPTAPESAAEAEPEAPPPAASSDAAPPPPSAVTAEPLRSKARVNGRLPPAPKTSEPAAEPPPAPSPSTAPLPDCDPPWEVDSRGIRRVKRHCIGR